MPEIRTLSEGSADDTAFLTIACSAEVRIGKGAKDKSVGTLDVGDVFCPYGSRFISHHADEVFFSLWTFLLARLEAPFAVARARVELRQTEPLRDHAREILWSISATLIFAVPGAFMLEGWELGWTQIYLEPARYGWSYFVLSPLLYMALHDTYFYWTHRLLHRPWWFRHAHYVHHQSLSPSPWASFSFHPLEFAIEALFIPALVFVLPIYVAGLLFVLTSMTIFGVINHLGYEIYPRFLVDRGAGRWFISVTHHNWHHRRFNCNYALYFRLWDIWMGTDRWPNVSAARAQRM